MANETDRSLINLRIDPETREDFKIAARLLGFKGMSQALHYHIVRTISEQKEKNPAAFIRNVDDESVGTRRVPIIEGPRASERKRKGGGR